MKKLLSSILILTLSFCAFNSSCFASWPNNQEKLHQDFSCHGLKLSLEGLNKQDKSNDFEEVKNGSINEPNKITTMEKTADTMKEDLKKHNEQVKNEIQNIKNMSELDFKLYLIKINLWPNISALYKTYFFYTSFTYFILKFYFGFRAGLAEGLSRVSGLNGISRRHLYTFVNNVQKILDQLLIAIKSGKAKNFDSIKELYYNATSLYNENLR